MPKKFILLLTAIIILSIASVFSLIYTISQSAIFTTDSLTTNISTETASSHLSIDTSQAPYSNLIAYYPFDVIENSSNNLTYDYSSNNNDGTLINGVKFNSSCIYGNCYTFDGSNDYINGSNLLLTDTGSISLWFKTNSSATQVIVSNSKATSPFDGIVIYKSTANRLYFRWDNIGSTNQIILTKYYSDNDWHNLVAVQNGTGLNMYFDGVLSQTGGTNFTLTNKNYNLKIGTELSANYFNGSIDEVMIFNTSLNSSQILELYNNQSKRYMSTGTQTIKQVNITSGYNQVNLSTQFNNYLSSNISARLGAWDVSLGYNNSDLNGNNGLVAYYHLEANNGTVNYTSDSSGNGNNGQCVNMGSDCNFTSGVYNNGVSFDGVNDCINLGNLFKNLNGTNQFTVSSWINRKTTAGNIFRDSDNIIFLRSVGYVKVNGVLQSGVSTSTTPPINDWYLLTYTVNAITGNSSIYLNGILSNTKNITLGNITWSNSVNYWSGCRYGSSEFLNGSIDEVMIFNRSLSSDEVKELYVKGRANFNYTEPQNLSNNGNVFNISSQTTNLLPEFNLLSGNLGTNFYSPNLINGITLETLDTIYPTFYNSTVDIVNNSVYNPINSYRLNITILNSNGTAGIEFNGVNYTLSNLSSIFNKTLSKLGVGTYSYYYWAYGNKASNNYNISKIYSYTINKSTPTLRLTSSTGWSISKYMSTVIQGQDCPEEITCSLYQSGTLITSPLTNTFNEGSYPFLFLTLGNENYTAASISNTLYSISGSSQGGSSSTSSSASQTNIYNNTNITIYYINNNSSNATGFFNSLLDLKVPPMPANLTQQQQVKYFAYMGYQWVKEIFLRFYIFIIAIMFLLILLLTKNKKVKKFANQIGVERK